MSDWFRKLNLILRNGLTASDNLLLPGTDAGTINGTEASLGARDISVRNIFTLGGRALGSGANTNYLASPGALRSILLSILFGIFLPVANGTGSEPLTVSLNAYPLSCATLWNALASPLWLFGAGNFGNNLRGLSLECWCKRR
jgi:hypothetical protein